MLLLEQLKQLLMSILRPFFMMLNPFVLLPTIVIIIILVKKNKEYKNGAYYQITKLPYTSVKRDTGRYGEYLTYKYLKRFETTGAKFLFNVFIPKDNGETAEIDVLMICSKGVFVFESKNYSGWIFGSEGQKNWYQTLPTGRGRSQKEHFYNPIMQNRSHIKHLKNFLGEQVPMHSIIVFSDRCTLKSIQITSNDISVINRYNVTSVVSAICNKTPIDSLSESDIINLFNKLYPYTQVDDIAKAQHIAHIHNNISPKSVQESVLSATQTDLLEVSAIEQSETKGVSLHPADIIETKVKNDKVQVHETQESRHTEPESKESPIFKCPKCNGKLVLRTATRGTKVGKQFYGCSNYPRCKFIQNIE